MADVDFFTIDIGKRSMKLVKITRKSQDSAVLDTLASLSLPQNLEAVIPSKEKPEQMELLASTIKALVSSAGLSIDRVVTALPESAIFTKMIAGLPIMEQAKLEEAIYWEAKQALPIPLEEAQTDWIDVREYQNPQGAKLTDVMFIAAPKELVEAYLMLFAKAELELIALEVESVAMARLLRFNYPEYQDNTMVIDFGSEMVDITYIRGGKLVFSQSISTGSDALTKAVASDFGLQFAQAEKYKMTYGMLTDQSDGGKIYSSIKPILDVVLNEIKKTMAFLNTRMGYDTPSIIFVTGGGALMPGLVAYLQANIGVQVAVLDPLNRVEIKNNMANIKNEVNVPSYAISVGLALKDE